MPNIISSLEIDEVSLCDSPANASVDEKTGRKTKHAVVALWKRDVSDTNNTKERKMGFKEILKSAISTRDEIVAAVEEKARRIAKRDGISDDAALVKAWREHPEAQAAYEAAPVAVAKKTARRMFRATAAEAELDKRARKRMRKTGQSYPQAVSSELNEDPGLYDKYQKELAAGATYTMPEPQYATGSNSDRMLGKSDDDDSGECPECGEDDIDDTDSYCRNCGADLAKRKAKSGRRAS
jgi:hypothetical protein